VGFAAVRFGHVVPEDDASRWVNHRRALYQARLAAFDNALMNRNSPYDEVAFACLDLVLVIAFAFDAEPAGCGESLFEGAESVDSTAAWRAAACGRVLAV
jgi:hypothetical protein